MIILKISVRFTLNELRCKFSSSFGIISGSEEGGILFLQITVMLGMKKKRMKVKEKHRVPEFFYKQEKRPFNNLSRNKTSREGVFFNQGLILLINVFQNSNIMDIWRDIC